VVPTISAPLSAACRVAALADAAKAIVASSAVKIVDRECFVMPPPRCRFVRHLPWWATGRKTVVENPTRRLDKGGARH